jgi:crotonobetainyl-CoA:carnitine CoA-transferase CaiB-like acyl-CoA transferase
MLAGAALCQGLLAALVGRGLTGRGRHIETSLLEALIDFQFEVLTTHLNDGGRLPRRSDFRSAHAYLSAPYGVYPTQDGFLALAMTPIGKLADLLEIGALEPYRNAPATWFTERDRIKGILASALPPPRRLTGADPRTRRHLVRRGADLALPPRQRGLSGPRHAPDRFARR